MCAQAPAAGGWTAACPQRAGDIGDLSPHFPVTPLTQKAQDCVLCAVRGSEMVPALALGQVVFILFPSLLPCFLDSFFRIVRSLKLVRSCRGLCYEGIRLARGEGLFSGLNPGSASKAMSQPSTEGNPQRRLVTGGNTFSYRNDALWCLLSGLFLYTK